ncbi:DUF4407 domain-containing protein [Microcystis aeruginosa]|nr:DUF4407 domain-containing protein [Microcystis aeruginosa]
MAILVQMLKLPASFSHAVLKSDLDTEQFMELLSSIFRSIFVIPQSFLIWWTGADNKILPSHARKAYAGLGAMAMVSTVLATFGGYTFILISLGSPTGGIFGAILAGGFMWGMDRSILGFSSQEGKKGNNSSFRDKFSATFWVKLAINIAFSSILTVPLSTFMLIGAIQVKNIEEVNQKIQQIDQKIDAQEETIDKAKKDLRYYSENPKLRTTVVSGQPKPNWEFINGEKLAQQALKKALEGKTPLEDDRERLIQEKQDFEQGDFTKAKLKFPDQFNYIMNDARWTDNLLSFLFFAVTALMGSGAVLIKTLVFTDDSYSQALERLEHEAKDQEKMKYAMNKSANEVCYTVFNEDAMSQSMINRLKDVQDQFEHEVERVYESLCNERLTKFKTEVERKKAEEEATSHSYRTTTVNIPNPQTKPKSNSSKNLQGRTPIDDLWKSSFSTPKVKNKSQNYQDNGTSKTATQEYVDDPWESSFSTPNKSQNYQDNGTRKTATQEDIMDIFNSVDSK